MRVLCLIVCGCVGTLTAVAQSAEFERVFYDDFEQWRSSQLAFSLAETTEKYQHGVFGDRFEYAALLGPKGEVLYRPSDKVIEDRRVRVLDLNNDDIPEILLVGANARTGASLVLLTLANDDEFDEWSTIGKSLGPAIGQGFRWMNPLDGEVDINGDGIDEIAVMHTPHIGGPVVIYSWQGNDLVPVQWIDPQGHSNHRYGDLNQSGSRFYQLEDGSIWIELRNRGDWSIAEPIEVRAGSQQ